MCVGPILGQWVLAPLAVTHALLCCLWATVRLSWCWCGRWPGGSQCCPRDLNSPALPHGQEQGGFFLAFGGERKPTRSPWLRHKET